MKNLILLLAFTLSSRPVTAQKFTFHSYMGVNYVLPTSDDDFRRSISSFDGTSLDTLDGDPLIYDPNEPDLINYPLKTTGKIGFTGGFEIRYNYKGLALSAGLESDVLRYKVVHDQQWLKLESDLLLAYLNFPVEIHYKLTKKIHLKIGGSLDYLAFTRETETYDSGVLISTSTSTSGTLESYKIPSFYNLTGEEIEYPEKDEFKPINLSLRGGIEYQIKKEFALFLNYRLKVRKVYNDGDDYTDDWENDLKRSKTSSITFGILVN